MTIHERDILFQAMEILIMRGDSFIVQQIARVLRDDEQEKNAAVPCPPAPPANAQYQERVYIPRAAKTVPL